MPFGRPASAEDQVRQIKPGRSVDKPRVQGLLIFTEKHKPSPVGGGPGLLFPH